ncbi:MAG: DAK2 domain-containing protein [Chloroflexota bacterium]
MTKGLRAGRVESCDGPQLQVALTAATAWVERNAEMINALNVFPVPDGDTGSNMWLTLQSAVAEANALGDDATAGAVAHAASHGALMGARGNSGVILSQILRGIARGLDSSSSVDATALAGALAEGAATAYKAVIKPVEGTILTVARESAEAAEAAAKGGADLELMLSQTVLAARESLARTPSLLPVLAEAGVVDAGGQGYLTLLEGLLKYFRGDATGSGEKVERVAGPTGLTEEPYGYCTEFIIQGAGLDIDSVRRLISAKGESVLVVGDDTVIRVHLHTFDPGAVLSEAVQHGTLHKIKIDNMQEQHREFLLSGQLELNSATRAETKRPDVPQPAAPSGDVALVAVVSGNGLTEVFRSLGATIVVPGGQTMNPSTGELLRAVESVPASAVIILPNNGNIVLTAQQVKPLSKKRLVVVPTQTIPEGVAALMAYNYESDLDVNAAAMTKAANGIHTVEVTRAVRAAKIDGVQVEEGAAIAVVDGKLVSAADDLVQAAVAGLAEASVDQAELITLYYGDGAGPQDADTLAKVVEQRWPGRTVEVVDGGQPHYPYIISVE